MAIPRAAQSRANDDPCLSTLAQRCERRQLCPVRKQALFLIQFYRRDWLLAIMTFDRNSEAVEFIKPNHVHRSRRAIGQYDRFTNKLGLRQLEIG